MTYQRKLRGDKWHRGCTGEKMEPQVIIASWCSSDLRGSTGALHLPAPKCRRPSEITEYINREPFKRKKRCRWIYKCSEWDWQPYTICVMKNVTMEACTAQWDPYCADNAPVGERWSRAESRRAVAVSNAGDTVRRLRLFRASFVGKVQGE